MSVGGRGLVIRRGLAAPSALTQRNQRFEDARLDDFALLIYQLPLPDDAAAAPSVGLLVHDFGHRMDGVADKGRTQKPPLSHGNEGYGVHRGALAAEPRSKGQSQQSMNDRPAEGRTLGEFVIHMKGIEITGQAGKTDDISFRDRSGPARPAITNHHIFEVELPTHNRDLSMSST